MARHRLTVCWLALIVGVAAFAPPAQASAVPSYQYVTDTMNVGANTAEAAGYALNIDGDRQGVRDNVLGSVLAGLGIFDVDASIAAALDSGAVVIRHTVRAHSLNGGPATWQVESGTPSDLLSGRITARVFNGGPGTVALQLGLVPGEPPALLHLRSARIQARCDPARCTGGKIGGGISSGEVDAVVIPALAAAMQVVVDASCPAACSDVAQNILALFDTDHDQQVTADELRANVLITAILAPDLDLVDATGRPGRDGVRDSLSLGLGFTASAVP